MIEIGGVAGTLILLVPFAVLLLTVVVAVLRRSSKRSGAPEMARSTAEEPAPPSASGTGEMLTAFGAMPTPEGPGARTDADEAPRIPLRDRIATAEGTGDSAALPALYLALAQEKIARTNVDEGADHLRSAIRLAAKARNPAVEADARLELAELARAAGDLTTACEHWQIARGLFHSLDRKDALAGTEDAMRRHGCPTDWVLTDF